MTEHEKLMDFERRLCERLDIPTSYDVCECGCLESAHWSDGCECRFTCGCAGLRIVRKVYPAVSRSGDGLLALVDALDRKDWVYGMENLRDKRGIEAYCILESREDVATALATTLPLALALAVAKAFGIEVPR